MDNTGVTRLRRRGGLSSSTQVEDSTLYGDMNCSSLVIGRKEEYTGTNASERIDVVEGVPVGKVESKTETEHNKEVLEV